jgi:hypothetical protein
MTKLLAKAAKVDDSDWSDQAWSCGQSLLGAPSCEEERCQRLPTSSPREEVYSSTTAVGASSPRGSPPSAGAAASTHGGSPISARRRRPFAESERLFCKSARISARRRPPPWEEAMPPAGDDKHLATEAYASTPGGGRVKVWRQCFFTKRRHFWAPFGSLHRAFLALRQKK